MPFDNRKGVICSHIQEISAYYLFQIFNNAGNIRAPFPNRTWTVNPKFNCDSTIASQDATAVVQQKKSICLFDLLIQFCEYCFPKFFNEKFSEYLFERCRPYTPVNKYWVDIFHETGIRTFVAPHDKKFEFQSLLNQQLLNNLALDEMNFQQYAVTQSTRVDFYTFYLNKKSKEYKKVWTQLEKIITSEKVERYCEIAYYPEDRKTLFGNVVKKCIQCSRTSEKRNNIVKKFKYSASYFELYTKFTPNEKDFRCGFQISYEP